MNAWGLFIVAAGAVLVYLGITGKASSITGHIKTQAGTTPTSITPVINGQSTAPYGVGTANGPNVSSAGVRPGTTLVP